MTSFLVPVTLCSTIGIVKVDYDCELLHPLTKKVDFSLGEQFEQGTKALLIRQDLCIELPLAHMF